jgi:cytochrome b6-f complex iron-sulfur subunit
MARGFDRRALLGGGCAWLAVGCAGDKTTASGHSGPTPTDGTTTDTGTAPTPFADYPCDQEVTATGTELRLTDYPDLAVVGGWYAVNLGAGEVVVAHVVEGCYAAVARACTHEGVAVDYVPARAQFVCPRHGAVYGADGEKVSGPQPAGVQRYPVGRVGDSIWVQA